MEIKLHHLRFIDAVEAFLERALFAEILKCRQGLHEFRVRELRSILSHRLQEPVRSRYAVGQSTEQCGLRHPVGFVAEHDRNDAFFIERLDRGLQLAPGFRHFDPVLLKYRFVIINE
ncbi:hypothetical protein D1872_298360 [compost metagenome]